MNREPLSDEVRRFILTSVPSVPYLEAVLLLRNEQEASWDGARLARRLYVPERQGTELLQALADAGIACAAGDARPAGHRYGPATAELSQRVDALAAAYASNLLDVTDLIHTRTDKRARQFADAFRLRKD